MIARRTILASGAAFVTIGLTGCGHNSPEKKATEKKTTPVRATTTASAPHRSDAVSTEALLADLATKAARSVTDGQRTVLNQVAAAHRHHLEVLSQSNPFSAVPPHHRRLFPPPHAPLARDRRLLCYNTTKRLQLPSIWRSVRRLRIPLKLCCGPACRCSVRPSILLLQLPSRPRRSFR